MVALDGICLCFMPQNSINAEDCALDCASFMIVYNLKILLNGEL